MAARRSLVMSGSSLKKARTIPTRGRDTTVGPRQKLPEGDFGPQGPLEAVMTLRCQTPRTARVRSTNQKPAVTPMT